MKVDGDAVEIVRGYTPGAIGRVAELHGAYYAREWGFGLYFEAKVASELSAFLSRQPPGAFWTASCNGRVEGSIAIDGLPGATPGAHLRWFIVSDVQRGRGAGGLLLDTALAHCREQAYGRVFLWTFAGLEAARHLYEKCGFVLVEEHRGTQWGTEVTEQRFELRLG